MGGESDVVARLDAIGRVGVECVVCDLILVEVDSSAVSTFLHREGGGRWRIPGTEDTLDGSLEAPFVKDAQLKISPTAEESKDRSLGS